MMHEFIIEVTNDEESEITGKDSFSFIRCKIDLNEIVAYREAHNNDNELVWTGIYLASGESFIVCQNYTEVESIIVANMQKLKSIPIN